MNALSDETDWQARCQADSNWVPTREPIGSGTVFLYSETTSPLPAASMYGYWQWFEGPADLAGYLRHIGVPGMLSIWFCRQEWDPDHASVPMGSREILAGAREHGYLVDDIQFVEGLLDRLEAIGGNSGDETLEELVAVTSAFSARFGQTQSWDLVLLVASTAASAGAVIADRLEWHDEHGPAELPEPFELEQWLALCRAADAGGSSAAALVAEVLANNDVF